MDKIKYIMNFINKLKELGEKINLSIKVEVFLEGILLFFCYGYEDDIIIQCSSKYINLNQDFEKIIDDILEEFILALEYAEAGEGMNYSYFQGGS